MLLRPVGDWSEKGPVWRDIGPGGLFVPNEDDDDKRWGRGDFQSHRFGSFSCSSMRVYFPRPFVLPSQQ